MSAAAKDCKEENEVICLRQKVTEKDHLINRLTIALEKRNRKVKGQKRAIQDQEKVIAELRMEKESLLKVLVQRDQEICALQNDASHNDLPYCRLNNTATQPEDTMS